MLLERLAVNLIDNAVRYNVDGGQVQVSTATAEGVVVLTVTNTGDVVPAYNVSALFEPFRRGSGRAGSPRGTGLGLSIVRAVARAHGATVTAEPNIGGGPRVCVAVPATPA